MFDSRILAQSILSLGIVASAFIGGRYFLESKRADQSLEVKGLAERMVKANEASWVIEFQVSDPDVRALNSKIAAARKAVEDFVIAQGFKAEDIQRPSVSISQPSDYSSQPARKEFRASGSIQVSSTNVDQVTKSAESTDSLLEKGVLMTRSAVSYYFTALNQIKPEMLEEAAKAAREAADRFAKNSSVRVGSIKRADQGPFSITAPFSEWGNETSSIMKRVRVVTTVQYFLER